jgi:predicted  nucleic acid-binding Zn-ribbon protein
MRELEAVRKELGQAEERNEKLKRDLEMMEATGGGDSAEHHALREQLTEMQAQGIAIQAAEERHARILAQCASAVLAMRAELSGEPTTKQESLHLQALSGRDALMQTLESAVEMAESRLGGGG